LIPDRASADPDTRKKMDLRSFCDVLFIAYPSVTVGNYSDPAAGIDLPFRAST